MERIDLKTLTETLGKCVYMCDGVRDGDQINREQ